MGEDFLGPDKNVIICLGFIKDEDWGKLKPKDTVNFINRMHNKAREAKEGKKWERIAELLKEAVRADDFEKVPHRFVLYMLGRVICMLTGKGKDRKKETLNTNFVKKMSELVVSMTKGAYCLKQKNDQRPFVVRAE